MVLTPTSRKTSRAIKKLRLESLGIPFLKVETAVNIGPLKESTNVTLTG